MINTILFDVDDTLYDCQQSFNRAVHTVFHGEYDQEIDQIYRRSRYWTDYIFVDYCAGKISPEEYIRIRNQNAFADCGIAITLEEAFAVMSYYREYQKKITMTEAMKGLLVKLRERGIITGVISNGVSETQWKKIDLLGIPDYISRENIIVSGDAGVSKPDSAIYDIACKKMGVIFENTWYAGDNYLNDIEAAGRVGLHTIWFNRKQNDLPESEIKPDCIVYSEEELIALLLDMTKNRVQPG